MFWTVKVGLKCCCEKANIGFWWPRTQAFHAVFFAVSDFSTAVKKNCVEGLAWVRG